MMSCLHICLLLCTNEFLGHGMNEETLLVLGQGNASEIFLCSSNRHYGHKLSCITDYHTYVDSLICQFSWEGN